MDFLKDKRIGLLAVIGPVYALTSIAICILLSPWFSWRDNAISDFGVSNLALIFNSSLIACGVLCSIFLFAMILKTKDWHSRLAYIILLSACISLAGIGIFNENIRPWHFIFSFAFFTLLILGSLLHGLYHYQNKINPYEMVAAYVVVILGVIAWNPYWGSSIAIPEAMTFVPGGILFMVMGYWHFKI